MALNRMMLALAFHLLALHLFALAVRHLFLALALENLALSRVPLALPVQRLWRRMRHGLANAGKRVAGAMSRARRVLSVGRRLVGSTVALAQFR